MFGCTVKSIACLAICASLGACSSRPPDCSSQQAASVARTILADEFTKVAVGLFSDPQGLYEPADVARVRSEFGGYATALRVDIKDAVQNGYDSDALKFSCSGRLTITAPTGNTFARDVDYSIQSKADRRDEFIVTIGEVQPFVQSLRTDFNDMAIANKTPFRFRPGVIQDYGASAKPAVSTPASPTAKTSPTSAPSACVEAKVAQARKELDPALARQEKEDEEKGYEFKGLSPVAEEEWVEKALQKAREACP